MYNAGDFDTTETVDIPFSTFDSNDPSASVTITNLAATDLHIHKDGGTTQRSSANGVTVSIDFDTITGNHVAHIDLSDNTDAGFYAAGSRYLIRMEGTTVDGATVNAWIGGWSIGCTLRPTTAGRTLDVTATGAAGIDWGNVENPTTAVDLSATDIQLCDTVTTLTGHTVQTGDSFARIGVAGAGLTNINLPNQTMDITGNLSGSVGSVTGNVGGSVASVVGHTAQTGDTYDLLTSGSGNVDINRLWIYNTDGGANDYGFQARSDSAHAFRCAALGGTGQHGFLAIGSSTNGSGVVGQGNGTGSGVYAYAAGTGGGFIMQSVSGDSLTESAGGTAVIANIDSKIDTVDSVVDAILVDTGTTIPATLGSPAGASMSADIATVDGNVDAVKVITDALTAAAAANLALSAAGIIGGTASGTPTTTTMDSDLSGYADDELIGRTVIWTGGTANGQASDITDYASTSGVVTFTAITTAPVSGDTFVVV